MSWLGRRAWMLVALLLLYSGLEKVLTQISASRELIDLGTIAGDAAARLPGGWWTLAGIELLLAGLLTIARTRAIGAAGAIVFLSVGIGLFAVELSRPAPRSCGCLGGGVASAATRADAVVDLWLSIARNLGLMTCVLPFFRFNVLSARRERASTLPPRAEVPA